MRFPNGTDVQWERLRSARPGAVLVVPMLDATTVPMMREYAAGTERYALALPKGRMEAGERPEAAVNREIMEEIGYGARRIRLIKSMTLAPGYFSHITHVLLARDLYAEKRQGDEAGPLSSCPGPWSAGTSCAPCLTAARRAPSPHCSWCATYCSRRAADLYV